MVQYTLIKTKRKSISVEIGKNGVVVRAPFSASQKDIENFLHQKENWIINHFKKYEKQQKETGNIEPLTDEQIKVLVTRAKNVFKERADFYAPMIGVIYNRITVRKQHTRWGSCSSKGNLNFNFLLMLAPPDVMDSVIVHELCHLKEMNHSKSFYNEVLNVFPKYNQCNKWLKENGNKLLAMIK